MAAPKSKSVGPDATQIMLQKNDRIKEKFIKDIRKLDCAEQRAAGDLEKQVTFLNLLKILLLANELSDSCYA